MSRAKLSAAVITKNEEAKIGDCLKSLSFADEVVVVDCGSDDRTVAIAEECGARVFHHDWPGHIEQKNYAIDQTSHDWILSLDADERVSGELRAAIGKALENPRHDAYAIPRLVYYTNRWIRHGGWYPAPKVRLFRRTAGRWGGENPHDRVITTSPPGCLAGDIYHLSFDSVSQHIHTIQNFTTIAAKERVAKGKGAGWFTIALRPPAQFLKMYILKGGFLDGAPGFIIAALSAWHVFCKYTKINELTKK